MQQGDPADDEPHAKRRAPLSAGVFCRAAILYPVRGQQLSAHCKRERASGPVTIQGCEWEDTLRHSLGRLTYRDGWKQHATMPSSGGGRSQQDWNPRIKLQTPRLYADFRFFEQEWPRTGMVLRGRERHIERQGP